MSTPDRSIDPRLIESARKSFLKNGFIGASLSEICADAGVTTGALYKRYKGKDELFQACVQELLDQMEARVGVYDGKDLSSCSDQKLLSLWCNTEENNLEWMLFLNSNRDSFILLVRCANGSRYENFRHDFCEKMAIVDYPYLVELQKRGLARPDISREELHMLLTGFWELICEPFVHDFDGPQIEKHMRVCARLINWKAALELKTGAET